jgi:2-polyprenyl-3-methyl-5-hydroxy-6-metoxy-1,4-benzoquinol methylase
MTAASESNQSDDWNSHWEHFDRSASENPAQRYRHHLLLSLLQRRGKTDRLKLLDLGSGQGDFLASAAKAWPQAELVGFELSEVGVLITRRKIPQARVFTVNLFAPPAEVAPLVAWAGVAICSEVLEHVDEPVAFLQASRPYLENGATLMVTVPGGPISAFDRYIGHRQHFTKESITRILEEAGFEVEQVTLAGFPFFNLYRALIIVRGDHLVRDATTRSGRASFFFARSLMALFRLLFRANRSHSRFGWQIVAVARKSSGPCLPAVAKQ